MGDRQGEICSQAMVVGYLYLPVESPWSQEGSVQGVGSAGRSAVRGVRGDRVERGELEW